MNTIPEADVAVILAAGGSGSRFQRSSRDKPLAGRNKVLLDIAGQAVWQWSIYPLLATGRVSVVILPCDASVAAEVEENAADFCQQHNIHLVPGGSQRWESIRSGIAAYKRGIDRSWPACRYIAVHDAARPCVSRQTFEACLSAAEVAPAVVPTVPITGTIKRLAGNQVVDTIDRQGLYQATTPQVFQSETLLQMYSPESLASIDMAAITDDAQLAAQLGIPVTAVDDRSTNLKVTTADDFELAVAILKGRL